MNTYKWILKNIETEEKISVLNNSIDELEEWSGVYEVVSFMNVSDHIPMEDYQKQRKRDYGPIGEQLDMLYRAVGQDNNLKNYFSEFYNHVKKVKEKHPKPDKG